MYAVIATGGKQYRVEPKATWCASRSSRPSRVPPSIRQVLLVGNGDDVKIGAPLARGQQGHGHVSKHGKGDKVQVIVKFRRRKHYLRMKAPSPVLHRSQGHGHRQA
jgi:large subunit ribosomal protein L21